MTDNPKTLDMQLGDIEQYEIDQMFAAIVAKFPVYAVNTCGWLEPYIVQSNRVKKFWELVKTRVSPNLDDEAADNIVSQILLESDLITDIWRWGDVLPLNFTPIAAAKELSRRHFLRAVLSRIPHIMSAVNQKDDVTARRIISEMANADIHTGDNCQTIDQIADDFEEAVMNGINVVKTFIPSLDKAYGGLEAKTLTLLGARPGMGKTALALQIARNVAVGKGLVELFSLEMSARGLWARMACPAAEIDWRDVLAGKLTPEQKARLVKESKDLKEMYRGKLNIREETATTESIWQICSSTQPALIIIDHVRLIQDKWGETDNKRQGHVSEVLHNMTKSLDVPILCLAQLSRKVEERADKRPVLSDLRDSGEHEENIDNCWMLYRDDYYNHPDDRKAAKPSLTEIWGRKFRNGASEILVNLQYDKKRQWFDPVETVKVNDWTR